MKKLIVAGLSALALAACASDPAPHPAANAYTEGYTERSLTANRYLIEYRMNGSDSQRAYELALWRAAEIAIQHGYPVFEIVDRDTATDPGSRPATTFHTEYGVAYHRSCGLVTCSTTATPVRRNAVHIDVGGHRPSRVVSLEIMLTRDPVGASSSRYAAADVLKNLKKR